ncbi:hypothetical protein EYF80_032698 [Liparis tanakae]|uniref:Uncharacterized protein n=1 Tax=Liparis tanakae TaxID=230148 RepID=A0A4Z2GWG6_9TELE|nr:hypothetical protein EYF80_032698 [Liparis tanakae]
MINESSSACSAQRSSAGSPLPPPGSLPSIPAAVLLVGRGAALLTGTCHDHSPVTCSRRSTRIWHQALCREPIAEEPELSGVSPHARAPRTGAKLTFHISRRAGGPRRVLRPARAVAPRRRPPVMYFKALACLRAEGGVLLRCVPAPRSVTRAHAEQASRSHIRVLLKRCQGSLSEHGWLAERRPRTDVISVRLGSCSAEPSVTSEGV